jgi:iron complex outermembrane receptor protein
MKKTYLICLLVFLYSAGNAQDYKKYPDKDTTVNVQLNEVTIKGPLIGSDQRIKDFYMANKAATTEDVLSKLPEINMIRRGSYGVEPLIRTYNTGQINLLVDGMRIHGACTDKMDPASIYIEPKNLQGIHIQTTHGAVAGSTIGGTVDFKLREADCGCGKRVTGYVSSGYQSAARSLFETAGLNIGSSKWAIRSNITYRGAEDYRSGGGEIVPYSRYSKLNYGLSAKYIFATNWYTKADFIYDDGWNIGYPALPMDVGYAAARIAAVSIVKQKVNAKWSNSEYKLYANNVYHLMDDTHRDNLAIHMDMPGHSNTFGSYANATLQFDHDQNMQFRADISTTELTASMTMHQLNQPPMYMLTWPDNRSIQAGFGAIYNNRFDTLSSITISARLDQFVNYLTSRAGKDQLSVLQKSTDDISRTLKNISTEMAHHFSPRCEISVIAGYAERMPSSSELYGFYLFNAFDNYDYVGSTTLKKEQAYKADINMQYTVSKIHFSFTSFATKIDNYILGIHQPVFNAMTIGANGVKTYENIEFAYMAGMEAGVFYKAEHKFQFISTFKYNYGTDNNSEHLPLVAPFKNVTSIRKQLKHWAMQLDAESACAQYKVNKSSGETPTREFFIAHVRGGYFGSLSQKPFGIDCGIENIFDVAYKEHLDWGKVSRPGRNLYIQVSYSF